MAAQQLDAQHAPLLVIVGPTASGKSALAIELAQQFNGEIICADSRTIFKGMEIGTAAPTVPEQQGIRHHLLSIVEPGQPFTVADFKQCTEAAIQDIGARGKVPILVGGSGLYIDAVLYDYQFAGQDAERSTVNTRHLAQPNQQQHQLRPDTLVLGVDVTQEVLEQRIAARVSHMLQDGLVDEARTCTHKYGWDIEPMKTYQPLRAYMDGEETLDQATEKLIIKDRQLAKKQRTWFKRNNSIQWVSHPRQAVELTTTFLNNYS